MSAEYFIYESPKIAAQDIEQQRKIASPGDAISRLANLNMSIYNTDEELNTASSDLITIEGVLESDGKYGVGFDASNYPNHYYYYDLLKSNDDSYYSRIYINSYKQDFYLKKMKLNEIDALLDAIKKATIYIESGEAESIYISESKTRQERLRESIQVQISEKDKLEKELDYMQSESEKLGEFTALYSKKNEIILKENDIRAWKQNIQEFDEKMAASGLLKDAEVFVNEALQANKKIIEQIEEYRLKVVNNLKHYKEKLPEQKELVNRLRAQEFNLDAEKLLLHA
ncbi:MAG: hypothetical protein IPP22_09305 [Nitrosomonas sp.]|nr:hypothetical protein [Nitrosomonas sp.]